MPKGRIQNRRLGNSEQDCRFRIDYKIVDRGVREAPAGARGFEVDFVIANSEATAKAAGKRVEQEKRADNAVNAHLCRAMTLDERSNQQGIQ